MERPGRLRTFAYVDSEKAALYRAVMAAFMAAKESFALHLRPDDVVVALADRGWALARDDVDPALRQLTEWGNLDSSPDTAEVATVEDFYRERRLFQLSREGEAAERALRVYEEAICQPGELQTAALADILELLRELEHLPLRPPDPVKAYKVLGDLFRRFEEPFLGFQTWRRRCRSEASVFTKRHCSMRCSPTSRVATQAERGTSVGDAAGARSIAEIRDRSSSGAHRSPSLGFGRASEYPDR